MRIIAIDRDEEFANGKLFEGDIPADMIARAMEVFHQQGGIDEMDSDIQALDGDAYRALWLAYPACFAYGAESAGDWVFDGHRPWDTLQDCYGLVLGQTDTGWTFIPTMNAQDHETTRIMIDGLASGRVTYH